MERILSLIWEAGLHDMDSSLLAAFRAAGQTRIADGSSCIYRRSVRKIDGNLCFIGAEAGRKGLYLVGTRPVTAAFTGTAGSMGGFSYVRAPLTQENAALLQEAFPFTRPVSLRDRMTTIGCGDRLGLATPGHIRAVSRYDVSPVLAQQSIRELALTGRTYGDVVRDVTFLVYQEGYTRGYGADGDHLKTIADIDSALAAGMPMITLDLTEVMNPAPAQWSVSQVEDAFSRLDAAERARVLSEYAGKTFTLGQSSLRFSEIEAKKCALMYPAALDFSREVDLHLREKRGERYDLEISIDETTAPTLPSHHVFFVRELARRGVRPSSLAPRFVGEFQKGIDYIGDIGEFERQFAVHCDIARAFGGYKISIHSGSDKFSVYPVIGQHTGMHVHVKTAGTSWLQAVRVIARADPALFRDMLVKARQSFAEASRLYHVNADPGAASGAAGLDDSRLESLLDDTDCRQLLHITYGGLLADPRIREGIFRTLEGNEDLHDRAVEEHMEKHLRLLGAPPALEPDPPF